MAQTAGRISTGGVSERILLEQFRRLRNAAALIVIDHCQLFDHIEMFRNQWRGHSTLGQISPATFERRAMTQVTQLSSAAAACRREMLLV